MSICSSVASRRAAEPILQASIAADNKAPPAPSQVFAAPAPAAAGARGGQAPRARSASAAVDPAARIETQAAPKKSR